MSPRPRQFWGSKAPGPPAAAGSGGRCQRRRRESPALPIIGTEPALKPAVERHRGGRILVMATEMTLHEEKFRHLQAQFQGQAQVEAVPCPGLMEFVEQGIFQGAAVEDYLRAHLGPYLCAPVDAVVLGCTHYPFLLDAIRAVMVIISYREIRNS